MSQIIIFTGSHTGGFFRNIGAYQIAHVLRSNGYSVQVIDWLPRISYEGSKIILKILKKFVSKETLWIGFSTTFFFSLRGDPDDQQIESKRIADNSPFTIEEQKEIYYYVRSISPKCRFVIGGARSYNLTGEHLIDTHILGYADVSVLDFTKWCHNKNPFFNYKIVESKAGRAVMIVDHNVKAIGYDFSNDLYKWDKSDNIFYSEALPVEISRGCVFKCDFCSYPLNGKKKLDYLKNPDILYEHFLYNFENFGTTRYVYADDTHNDSVEKLEILYDKVYSKLPFKLEFAAYIRLDLINAHPHTLDLLKASGLKSAFFGIESLNYESNKTIGKGIKQDKIIQILEKIKLSWGDEIRTDSGFIIGLPNDSIETVDTWLKILENNFPLDSFQFNALHINTKRIELFSPWNSPMELNPEKYGYTFDENGWINNTGMTFKNAWDMHLRAKKNLGEKIPWAAIFDWMNLGLDFHDVKHLENSISTRKNVSHLKEKLFQDYMAKILGQ